MTTRTFTGRALDLGRIADEVKFWFEKDGYETQVAGGPDGWLVQARKTSAFRTFTGTNQAFSVQITGTPDDMTVEVGTGKWVENLAGAGLSGALLTGGLTWITGGIGIVWLKKLENDFWTWIDNHLRFGAPATVVSTARPVAPAVMAGGASIPEEIKKLHDLHTAGILTKDEFESKKKELLARM
ncbi:MAG TPA: SHOCT domain-containing protein [Planctomycetota bacterium]|nr:SHOCT domain-containing protein [Planctomycetota bacterium]